MNALKNARRQSKLDAKIELRLQWLQSKTTPLLLGEKMSMDVSS